MAINKQSQLFKLTALKWKIILATSLTLATGLVSLYIFYQLKINSQILSPATTASKSQPTSIKVAVTALGRLQPKDKIIFLEDVGEQGYQIDRMLNHLFQAGVFSSAKALIFGEINFPIQIMSKK